MNALFNALNTLYFFSKSARTLTHFIYAMNVRNNYGLTAEHQSHNANQHVSCHSLSLTQFSALNGLVWTVP